MATRLTEYAPRVSGVYSVVNTSTGERYIGSSKNIRLRAWRHRNELLRGQHHSKHMQAAFDTSGVESFAVEVLEYVADVSQLVVREQYYMDQLRPAYNTRTKALSTLGKTASTETRAKLAAHWQDPTYRKSIVDKVTATRNRPEVHAELSRQSAARFADPNEHALAAARTREIWQRPGHREKVSAAQQGRTYNAETLARMSESHRGKVLPPEQRAKISAAHKGRPKSPEHVAKVAAAIRGTKRSPEARAKMAEAQRRRFADTQERARNAEVLAEARAKRRGKVKEAGSAYAVA